MEKKHGKKYDGFIWVGITRTGSGSMASLLNSEGRNRTSKDLKKHYSDDAWSNKYKFTFVRHPLNRFISAYTSQGYHLEPRVSVEKALKSGSVLFTRQVDFLTEKMDFIGRYENINEDWAKVAEQIGAPEILPYMNKRSYEEPWKPTKEEEKRIREFYKKDFKRFDYV